MSTLRKFKLKSNKNKSVVKQRIILLGRTQDNEPIFMHAETKSVLDAEYNKALSKLYNEVKLPIREKRPIELRAEEKELYNMRDESDRQSKMIVVYDETNPEFISKKNETEILRTLIYLVSFFKMDETVEDDNGNEITHWEDWGLNKKDGLLAVAKFIADKEKGLGMSEKEIIELQKEIEALKSGKLTMGEYLLDISQDKINLKNDVMKEVDKIKDKLAELEQEQEEDEDDGEEV